MTVNRSGWSRFDVADRNTEWDSNAATDRLQQFCDLTSDTSESWDCYASGFLWAENPAARTQAAYKLPIIDIVDGEKTIIPQAVISVAGVLSGARGGGGR